MASKLERVLQNGIEAHKAGQIQKADQYVFVLLVAKNFLERKVDFGIDESHTGLLVLIVRMIDVTDAPLPPSNRFSG